ncbi:MAG: ABC transporter permease [Eubacteriales bacterium]|nr:ABC transporter permease [Eubacteriales bacterium]
MKREKSAKNYYFLETLKRLEKGVNARIGTIILIVLVFCCVFAPLVAPYGQNDMDLTAMCQGPSLKHLCGTDNLGRDIFSRLLYGGRFSLALGLASSVFGMVLSVILGSIAGYFGGKVENIIMRLMDIWASLPGILLCILISTAFGAGFFNTILALSVSTLPGGVRTTRAQILKERSMEYLEAAESINCSKVKIMFGHLLPNVFSPMLVGCTMGIGNNIMMAATLSYIGLGVQPPTPEWGAMLADARSYILVYPHMIIWPGIFIALTVFAINLLGDALRDALDPKLRS